MSTFQYPRVLRPEILRDLDLYPVVALMGARQVGKSTLGYDIAAARGMAYRTLDDRDALEQARVDPEGLLADLDGFGFIDEAQRAPELFLALKAVVDRQQRPGQYLLSGSNQPRMSGAVGDSLLGRAAYRTLRPLITSELRLEDILRGWDFLFSADHVEVLKELERRKAASGPLAWCEAVQAGGFPRALAAPSDLRQRVLNDYVQVFASRDIRELLSIESSDRFEQLMRLAAARTGQVLNVSGLSAELGIPVSTVRRWIGALQQSFLVEMIPAFSRNAGHRMTKAPKLFFADCALALAAAQESVPTGFHLENLVATDLLVWRDAAPGRSVHHWRTQSGQEVDFILGRMQHLVAVELKASDSVGDSDAKHLRTFVSEHGEAVRGILLSSDERIRMLRDGIVAAPWWSVL